MVRHGDFIDAIGYITGDVRDSLPLNCDCNAGYTGAACSIPTCYGISKFDSNACSGLGQCIGPNQCSCSNVSVSDFHNCQPYAFCHNQSSLNVAANVCSGKGTCQAAESLLVQDQSICDPGYFGDMCQYTKCYGFMNNDTLACSGNGKCVGPDTCQCTNDTIYTGKQCSLPVCYGFNSLSSDVCSSHGICEKPNSCKCYENFNGTRCENFNCFGIPNNSSLVCSGKGICVSNDTCQCINGYSGANCSDWRCFGISKDQSDLICSGNGNCLSYDKCSCKANATGANCSLCSVPLRKPPFCEVCIDGNYGADCSNTILGNLNMLDNGNTLQLKMSSLFMSPQKSGSNTCDRILSSNSLKFFSTIRCSFTRDSSYTSLTMINSRLFNHTGFNYTITITGDYSATFVPGTVMEINVLWLYNNPVQSPIYISIPISDQFYVYKEPSLSLLITNRLYQVLSRCHDNRVEIYPFQFDGRTNYQLIWEATTPGVSDTLKTILRNSRDKTVVMIPYGMTVNGRLNLSITFITAFGKTKVFNFTLLESIYDTFERDANFKVTLDVLSRDAIALSLSTSLEIQIVSITFPI